MTKFVEYSNNNNPERSELLNISLANVISVNLNYDGDARYYSVNFEKVEASENQFVASKSATIKKIGRFDNSEDAHKVLNYLKFCISKDEQIIDMKDNTINEILALEAIPSFKSTLDKWREEITPKQNKHTPPRLF